MKDFKAPSVSELVNSIKDLLEDTFNEVMVQGEITNISMSGSGHWYFNLSDEDALISCALFKGDAFRNPMIKSLKEGDKVIIYGPISVYQKRGSFQILVKRILSAGEGSLKLQFEKMKARLAQEGLFDLDRKKQIPPYPKKIAIITALNGAALQDFINVYKRRSLWMDLLIIPALVQGEGAPLSLVNALSAAEKIKDLEIIVLARGGGSAEDLWAFNDEALVRAIAKTSVPVISAVGHQVDFTLCDFVADFRAETPTAAAETLTQPQTELMTRLIYCQQQLNSRLKNSGQQLRLRKEILHPRAMLMVLNRKLFEAEKKLSILSLKDRMNKLISLEESQQILDECFLKMNHAIKIMVSLNTEKILRADQVLKALNPKLVLKRGYTYISSGNEEIVASGEDFDKVSDGQNLNIHFHDGVRSVRR